MCCPLCIVLIIQPKIHKKLLNNRKKSSYLDKNRLIFDVNKQIFHNKLTYTTFKNSRYVESGNILEGANHG